MRRTLALRLGLALPALVIAWLASTGIVTWTLLHRARPAYVEPLPASLKGRAESVTLATRDGETLGAWWSSAQGGDLAVLLVHSNGESRAQTASVFAWLVDQKIAALAPSLRAHGDSSGHRIDMGWSERADVSSAVEFLERHAPGARIVVVGRSLGAVAAILDAGELSSRVSAYVLEAPFRDLASAVHHRLRMHLPAPAEAVAFAGMRVWSRVLLPVDIDELSPIDRVRDIPLGTAVVFLSGTEDAHTPTAEVEEIARNGPPGTRLVRFDGASHGSLAAHDPARYQAVLAELFTRLEGGRGPSDRR